LTSSHKPKWTFILIATAVLGFVIQQATSPFWLYGAFFPAYIFQFPWSFITAIFLHSDFTHLFFNMFALFFFGIQLEKMIGRRRFLFIFFSSGIIGNIGYLLSASNPFTPAIGASGAVYGVMGTLATLAPFMLIFVFGMLPLPMILAAALWIIIDIAGLFAPSGIANGAHLGGMGVGIIFGLYLRLKYKKTQSSS